MQSEGAKSRREFFRKNSSTSLARKTVDETDMAAAQERLSLMAGVDIEEDSREGDIENLSNDDERPSVRNKSRAIPTCPTENAGTNRTKPNRLMMQRRSLTDPGDDSLHASAVAHLERRAMQDRSASSPSLVLSKVKEKIRKKVAIATDWRDSKAMALEKFSATTQVSNSRGRSSEKRRTLSEVSRDSSSSLRTSGEDLSPEKQKAGIVCSTKDLEAILGGKSTANSKFKVSRSLSVDCPPKTKANQDKNKQKSSDSGKKLNKHSSLETDTVKSDNERCPTKEELVLAEKSLMESLLKPQTVKDVQYDDQGETWEIYGAEFDPEVLGDAIQKHLKKIEPNEPDEYLDRNKNDIKKKNKARRAWLRMFESISQRRKKTNSTG